MPTWIEYPLHFRWTEVHARQRERTELVLIYIIYVLSRVLNKDNFIFFLDCVCNGAGGTAIFQALCGGQEVLWSTSSFCYAHRLHGGTSNMLWWNVFFFFFYVGGGGSPWGGGCVACFAIQQGRCHFVMPYCSVEYRAQTFGSNHFCWSALPSLKPQGTKSVFLFTSSYHWSKIVAVVF